MRESDRILPQERVGGWQCTYVISLLGYMVLYKQDIAFGLFIAKTHVIYGRTWADCGYDVCSVFSSLASATRVSALLLCCVQNTKLYPQQTDWIRSVLAPRKFVSHVKLMPLGLTVTHARRGRPAISRP